MSFEGIKINQINGGLGRTSAQQDNVFGLAYALDPARLPTGIELNKAYRLMQASDAVKLGFSLSYDANHAVLVSHAVTEFFRLAPTATLYLIAVKKGVLPAPTLNDPAFKSCIRELSAIKCLGIGGIAETATTLAEQVEAVQGFVNDLAKEHRLIDAIILAGAGAEEGGDTNKYPDLRLKKAPNVSVCIAQDAGIAAMDAAYQNYADIGAVLGMLAVRHVNENLGSVNITSKPDGKKGARDYPLTDPITERFLSANLSDGTPIGNLSGVDKADLTKKGYVYAGSYEGYAGIFFNSSPTCVALSSDYAYIENNRVWNKAARLIRSTLLPEIKGVVKKDPATGYIKSTSVSRWSMLVNAALERMEMAEEISGYSVSIDAKQVLSETSPLKIKATVVASDIVHEMVVDLGLSNKA